MHVAVVNGVYRCYTTPDGIRRHYLGCRHESPRQAIAHTVPVYVSPTRSVGGSLDHVIRTGLDRSEPPIEASGMASPAVRAGIRGGTTPATAIPPDVAGDHIGQ